MSTSYNQISKVKKHDRNQNDILIIIETFYLTLRKVRKDNKFSITHLNYNYEFCKPS